MKKKILLIVFLLCIVLAPNVVAKAASIPDECKNITIIVYNSGGKRIDIITDIMDIGGNNESSGSTFLNADDKTKLAKEQLKSNHNGDGSTDGYLIFWAQSDSYMYVSDITMSPIVNGNTKGTFSILGSCKADQLNHGSIKFKMTVKTSGFTNEDVVSFNLAGTEGCDDGFFRQFFYNLLYSLVGNTIDACPASSGPIPSGGIPVSIELEAFTAAANAKTEEEQKEVVQNNITDLSKLTQLDDKDTPLSDNISSMVGDKTKAINCDDSMLAVVNNYWDYVIIIVPILLILMCTIDFVKATASNDDDALKKAVSDTIKRTIAAVLLLALKMLITTIMTIFGLSVCF